MLRSAQIGESSMEHDASMKPLARSPLASPAALGPNHGCMDDDANKPYGDRGPHQSSESSRQGAPNPRVTQGFSYSPRQSTGQSSESSQQGGEVIRRPSFRSPPRRARTTSKAFEEAEEGGGSELKKPKKKVEDRAAQRRREERVGKVLVIIAVTIVTTSLAIDMFIRYVIDDHYDQARNPTPLPHYKGDSRWSVTDTSPTSHMGDQGFVQYMAIVLWISVVMTGLGTELFVGWYMMNAYPDGSRLMDQLWMVAQFLFPLCAFISFVSAGHRNAIGLPFLVAGLWKFGFPETLGCISSGIILWDKGGNRAMCAKEFLDGLGTVCHHSSAALLISVLTMGLAPFTRHIGACILPLVMQHLFVLLKYKSTTLYVLVELALDVLFQWEIFSNFEWFYGFHGHPISADMPFMIMDPLVRRAAAGMLFAHWLYLSAAAIGLVHDFRSGGADGSTFAPRSFSGFLHSAKVSEQLMMVLQGLNEDNELREIYFRKWALWVELRKAT